MTAHRATLAAVALTAIAITRAAHAQPATTADQHRDAGYRHVERSEWDAAVDEYQAAYAIDHDPVSIYAIGRVHIQRGDCAAAIDAFRRFLELRPSPRARTSAAAEIAKCEAVLAAAAPAPDGPAAVDEPIVIAPPPAPPHRRQRPFSSDPLGSVLVGGGVVAGGLGAYFYVRARGELCDDPCTGSYQAYQDGLERARTWRTTAVIAGSVGAGLIVAGTIRWLTHRDAADDVEVAWSPRPGGGAVVLGGRF